MFLSSASFLEDDFFANLGRRMIVHVLELFCEFLLELGIEVVVEGFELFLLLDFIFFVGDYLEHSFLSVDLIVACGVIFVVEDIL